MSLVKDLMKLVDYKLFASTVRSIINRTDITEAEKMEKIKSHLNKLDITISEAGNEKT